MFQNEDEKNYYENWSDVMEKILKALSFIYKHIYI